VLTHFVVARTESLRDLVSTILKTNLTIQGNRQNAIMERVTSWAAIIAVPTAVPGYYAMNVPYPGSASTPASSPRPCCWWCCPAACTSSSNASTGSDTGSLAATPLRWILLTLRLCSASGALAAWLEQPDPP
jgi:hypothetical protein